MVAKPDCTGQKFGRLTVLGKGDRSPSGIQMWLCQCDCGETVQRNRFTLEHSAIPSCGCEKRERFRNLALSRSKPDCTGQRFGRLTVLGKTEDLLTIGKQTRGLWLCQCDCGNTVKLVREYFERDKNPQRSCGCLYKERKGKPNHKNAANLAGQMFGNLTAIERILGKTLHNKPVWLCRCDCGATVERSTHQLRLGYGVGLNCGDRSKHQFWLKYPPTPIPYPPEAGAIVAKYLHLTKPSGRTVDTAVEDRRVEKLLRAAWILCCRRSSGEEFSELKEKRFIRKHLRFCKVDVFWKRKIEAHGGLLYNVSGIKKQIGGVMTDLTSQNEAVNETQPKNMLPIRRTKRLKFKRC